MGFQCGRFPRSTIERATLESIASTLREIQNDIAEIKNDVADIKELLERVERRVGDIEPTLTSLTNRITPSPATSSLGSGASTFASHAGAELNDSLYYAESEHQVLYRRERITCRQETLAKKTSRRVKDRPPVRSPAYLDLALAYNEADPLAATQASESSERSSSPDSPAPPHLPAPTARKKPSVEPQPVKLCLPAISSVHIPDFKPNIAPNHRTLLDLPTSCQLRSEPQTLVPIKPEPIVQRRLGAY
ncbi:hypothetical protein C8F01DRAFT_1288170 [Mycena amicta]|nr:hypothetical protein C8F01DRAFT_1288170 [Mycena amicta]